MGEAGIAATMAQDIATSVLAGQAANLTDPIFASLGIAQGSDTDEKYFNQVMGELTKIEGDLNKIAAKLLEVSSGISVIESALTAISSQITDSELQTQLTQYKEYASTIDQNYEAYATALAAMAKGDNESIQAGTNQLFQLFEITNSDQVAAAMQNIRDLLVGSDELRGIISYQSNEVREAYDKRNVLLLPDHRYPDMGFGSFIDATMGLLTGIPVVLADTCDQAVLPTLKAALAAELKGLSFLCAAWGAGTINEPRLAGITSGISDVIEAIHGLYASFDIDTLFSDAMQKYCTRLTVDQINTTWWMDGNIVNPAPFDDEWVLWRYQGYIWRQIYDYDENDLLSNNPNPTPGHDDGPYSVLVLVQKPWQYGTAIPTYCLTPAEPDPNADDNYPVANPINVGSAVVVSSDGESWYSRTDTGIDAPIGYTPAHLTVPRPSTASIAPVTAGITPPPNFMSFLASLPVTAVPDVPMAGAARVRDLSSGATGAIYLMIDGALRVFPNQATYNNLYPADQSGVKEIATAKAYPRTLPLTDGAYIAKGTPDGKVFLILDGTKRWIIGPGVFEYYGFDGQKIRTVPADQLEAIPNGPDIN